MLNVGSWDELVLVLRVLLLMTLLMVVIGERLVGGNHLGLVLLERVVVDSVVWLLRVDLVGVLTTGWWWWGKWVLLFSIECMRLGWSIVLIYVNAVYLELLHQILLNYLNWRCIRFSLRRLAFL